MTKSRTLRKAGAVALSLAMAFSVAGAVPANAAAKKASVTLKTSSATFKSTGGKKNVVIKNVSKSNVKKLTVTSKNKAVATAKKKTNVKFLVTAKKNTDTKAKSAKIIAKVVLKKIKAGKKTYKKKNWSLTFTAKVKAASAPAPTATPEVPATGLTLDKVEATVMAGQTVTIAAQLTPADSTDIVEWTSSDEKIATVAGGVVTGVAEGKATITAKVREFTQTCEVTVTKAEIVASLVSAKQTAANGIELTFDVAEAKTLVNKDDIKIDRVDGLATIPVNSLKWSEDGKVATATLSSAFADQIDYQVSYKGGAAISFKASVGAVASILIKTASAEQNVKTNIEFALVDAQGIDVTSNVKVDQDVDVAIEALDGASITADTTKPSQASVTMTTVGDKAKVTIKYAPAGATTTVNPAEGIVTCTAPTATVGNPRFKATTSLKEWSDNTYCAKFYTGSDDTNVGVTVGGNNPNVYFCAEDKEKKGEIIAYDSYDVSSSNDDVASASIEDGIDAGKYCRINVAGNGVGTANILVKATKNGASYTYTIPVTVVGEKTLQSISAKASRSTMSNAIDEDYYGTIEVTGKYSDGSTANITGQSSFDLVDKDKKQKLSANLLAVLKNEADPDAAARARGAEEFDWGKTYWANGAQGTQYTIAITASNDEGKEFKTRVSIDVKDLAQKAWDTSAAGEGAKMEYSMEFTDGNVLDVAGGYKTTARLAAYTNKLFAGYVRGDGVIGTATDHEDGVVAVYANESGYTFKASAPGAAFNGYTFKVTASSGSTITVTESGIKKFTIAKPATAKPADVAAAFNKSEANEGYFIATVYDEDKDVDVEGKDEVFGSGTVKATAATQISDIYRAVKFGSNYNYSGVLYNSKDNGSWGKPTAAWAEVAGTSITLTAKDTDGTQFLVGKTNYDKWLAKPGTYTVTFFYTQNGKDAQSESKVTVKNSYVVPKVTVTSRTVESLDDDGLRKVLSIDCDMNNNTSAGASFINGEVYKNDSASIIAPSTADSDKWTVSWVGVEDQGIEFIVPVNATLKTE